MEKELERGTYILNEDGKVGAVQIADDVVAMIASLAATEVEGVGALVGNISNELMSKVGMKKLTKGVKVEVINKKVIVDLLRIQFCRDFPKMQRHRRDVSGVIIERTLTASQHRNGTFKTA